MQSVLITYIHMTAMVKKTPSAMLHAVGDSPPPRRSGSASACATASPVVAAAVAGAAAPIAHASAAPPLLSKHSDTGKKSAKDRAADARNTASRQYPLPTANGRSSRAPASSATASAAPPHPLCLKWPLVRHRLKLSLRAAQGQSHPGTQSLRQRRHR